MFSLQHEIPRAKTQSRGLRDCFFFILRCLNKRRTFFARVEVCLSSMINWHGSNRIPKATSFCNHHDPKTSHGISKPQCSLHPGGVWLSGHNFQSFDFWGVKFFVQFSPLRSVGFCLPPAVTPEAGHRCIWRPWGATSWSSSGSSRPRRPWMRRRKTAVTWTKIWGGKLRHGIVTWSEEVDEMLIWLMVQVFSGYRFHFLWKGAETIFGSTFFVVLCDLFLLDLLLGSFFFSYWRLLLGNRLARSSQSEDGFVSGVSISQY